MGIFDTFYDKDNNVSSQLKVRTFSVSTPGLNYSPSWKLFEAGNDRRVGLQDGLYFTDEGIVVIKSNKFIGVFNYSQIKNKFGESEPLAGKMNYVRYCSDKPDSFFKNVSKVLEKEDSQ